MRRASLLAFFVGVLLYPLSLYFTADVIGKGIDNGRARVETSEREWRAGRVFSIVSVALLAVSVVLAFLAPPSRLRKRTWWAVPAVVIAIGIVYFDWIGFGLGFG